MLRDYSLVLLVLPVVAAVVGATMILSKSETGLRIVCQLGWLVAILLICFGILAWEVSWIPVL